MLTDLCEGLYLGVSKSGNNFSHELGNEMFAGNGVTKMGSDWLLAKLLNHDRNESIKHAGMLKKLFRVDLGLTVKRVDVVKQIEGEILLDPQVLLFVLNKISFYFFVW